MSRIWNIQNTYQNSLKANILRRLKRYCFTENCNGNEEGVCRVCSDEVETKKITKTYVHRTETQLATANSKNSPFASENIFSQSLFSDISDFMCFQTNIVKLIRP